MFFEHSMIYQPGFSNLVLICNSKKPKRSRKINFFFRYWMFNDDLVVVITSQGRKNLVVIKNKRGYLGILGIFDNLINYVRKSKILVFFLEILPIPNKFCLFFGTEFIKSDTGIMVTPSPIQNQGEFKEKVTRG